MIDIRKVQPAEPQKKAGERRRIPEPAKKVGDETPNPAPEGDASPGGDPGRRS